MIEVAIASVEAVFDWKGYLEALENGTVEQFLNKKESPMVAMDRLDDTEDEEEDQEQKGLTRQRKEEAPKPVAAVKRADRAVRRGQYFHQPEEVREKDTIAESTEETSERIFEESAKSKEEPKEERHQVAALKKAAGVRRPMQPIEELRRDSILMDSVKEDEDDEILSALDKFFEE